MASTVQQAKAGQTSEFVQLLTGSQSRLYAYICSLTGRASSARDILQDTNVVLWDKAREYDPERPFLPWAYRIAYFQVLAYRKSYARSRLVFDEQLVSEMAEELIARDDDHDRRLEALGSCLEKLPGSKRDLLDRRYLHNETVHQIATRLYKSPNVVSAFLYRLRRALLECIESSLASGSAR
jgi:RNA polymerase sigma-70 factor, ECF subfamily